MNEQAILALIGDLYAQIVALQKENEKLRNAQEDGRGDAPGSST